MCVRIKICTQNVNDVRMGDQEHDARLSSVRWNNSTVVIDRCIPFDAFAEIRRGAVFVLARWARNEIQRDAVFFFKVSTLFCSFDTNKDV